MPGTRPQPSLATDHFRPCKRRAARGGSASIRTEGASMEVHPGVFVSNVSTSDFHPDGEIGGDAEEHVLVDNGEVRAGFSRFPSDGNPEAVWKLPAVQVLVVLEGEARIEIEDGPTLELKTGDMAALPKGVTTTWHMTLPFKEMWVLA